MTYGAGVVAAKKFGAAEMLDPRPYVVGRIKAAFEQYPGIGPLLPALGYGPEQIADLEATVRAVPADAVLIATPIDLRRFIKFDRPAVRVSYESALAPTWRVRPASSSGVGSAHRRCRPSRGLQNGPAARARRHARAPCIVIRIRVRSRFRVAYTVFIIKPDAVAGRMTRTDSGPHRGDRVYAARNESRPAHARRRPDASMRSMRAPLLRGALPLHVLGTLRSLSPRRTARMRFLSSGS